MKLTKTPHAIGTGVHTYTEQVLPESNLLNMYNHDHVIIKAQVHFGNFVGNVGFHIIFHKFTCRKPEISVWFPLREDPGTGSQYFPILMKCVRNMGFSCGLSYIYLGKTMFFFGNRVLPCSFFWFLFRKPRVSLWFPFKWIPDTKTKETMKYSSFYSGNQGETCW